MAEFDEKNVYCCNFGVIIGSVGTRIFGLTKGPCKTYILLLQQRYTRCYLSDNTMSYENMASSIKPEVLNVTQRRRQRRTDP